MRGAIGTLAFVLGLAGAAAAQDGGKLNWMGKTGDPKTAILDARDQNRPIMLLFTSLGCPACSELSAGAFSDPKVVEASRNVACIFVDCDWGNKNKDLSAKYGVKYYPTVLMCDPTGKVIGELKHRDADKVANALKLLSENVGAKAPVPAEIIVGNDYEKARVDARKKNRPLLVFFGDTSPASLTTGDSLVDPSLNDLHPRFSTAKIDFVKGSADCVKFGVTRSPTILILDCSLPRPEEKPLGRIEGSKTPRELRRELEAYLPSRDPGSAPAVDLPPVRRDVPEEKLSDDQIERKFIWARVAVAQDTLKRGSKDKAIEILEDVLKSYPKHKDTEDVKKVLEEMRKK